MAPEMLSISYVLEFQNDADLVALALQSTQHQEVGPETARDFRQWLGLIGLARSVGGADTDIFQLKQLRRKCFLDTLRQVPELRWVAENFQGQYGDKTSV